MKNSTTSCSFENIEDDYRESASHEDEVLNRVLLREKDKRKKKRGSAREENNVEDLANIISNEVFEKKFLFTNLKNVINK